jgi:hypothetical protein
VAVSKDGLQYRFVIPGASLRHARDRDHDHGIDAVHRRSRHMSRGNSERGVHPGRAFDMARVRDRNRYAAQSPSIPRRPSRYPSWSRSHGGNVSCDHLHSHTRTVSAKPRHSSVWHSRLWHSRSALRQTCVLYTSRSQPFHRIVRGGGPVGLVSAAAGKMRRERVRKRAESTARHAA